MRDRERKEKFCSATFHPVLSAERRNRFRERISLDTTFQVESVFLTGIKTET